MADRADWDAATRAQRHLAVAADAELRRRHPGRRYPPLRSAEPPPVTQAQRDELTLTAGVRMLSGRVRMRGARDGCAEPGAKAIRRPQLRPEAALPGGQDCLPG
jgi:hypothetical protein